MTRHPLACLPLLLACVAVARAAPPGALAVAGAVSSPGTLLISDLRKLDPEPLTFEDHAGKHTGQAVRLDRILARFGFSPGPMGKDVPVREKRSGWKKVVRATAADGFEAVFSCAEIAEAMGTTRAYVLFEVDGKPLPPGIGPLRVVVPTDKEPSRAVRQLVGLEVLDLRSRAP